MFAREQRRLGEKLRIRSAKSASFDFSTVHYYPLAPEKDVTNEREAY